MSNKALLTMGWLLVVLAALSAGGAEAVSGPGGVVTATINGLEIALDAKTGSILGLTYPGPGRMLQTTPDAGGILDLACPQENHPALRRASRFSSGVKISQTASKVTIQWENVGTSEPSTDAAGPVAATVVLEAAPDGRSMTASCRIENRSTVPITQVLFPDLIGLTPFGGTAETFFRTGCSVIAPFANLRPSPPEQLVGNPAVVTFLSGSSYGNMGGRWMDFGSLAGGLSFFPKCWWPEPDTKVLLHRWNTTGNLRLVIAHDVKLAPGANWESGQFVLTPHVSGWAKGIEPYRQFVKQTMKRIVPLPNHVRKGMGFRTLWMCQAQPFDPQDANFTFGDLPRLAEESKEYGLDEMVLWFTQDFFEVPLPPFFQHLGGEAELVKAVVECKKIGVNVALFISVKLLNRKSAGRYDVKIPPEGTHFSNFSYHPEFIPRFAPPYSDYYRVGGVSLSNPLWRSDLLASCRRLSDIGIPSISWDLFSVSVAAIGREICTNARQHDAESTFSGEDVESLEFASEYLDYTWNWKGERDTQPLVNAFPAPRFNYNVDASPLDVKRCFARSQFLNVQPRKPDGVNGSDWIKNHPELSRALKQCTKLHAQFLTYFVDGTPIGDCILSKPCRGAQVCAYVLPDKILIIVLNTGAKGEFPLACNLRPWLESTSGRYLVKSFDGAGRMRGSIENQEAGCALTTGVLDGLDIALFEILPQ